jgi:hypothetical protein
MSNDMGNESVEQLRNIVEKIRKGELLGDVVDRPDAKPGPFNVGDRVLVVGSPMAGVVTSILKQQAEPRNPLVVVRINGSVERIFETNELILDHPTITLSSNPKPFVVGDIVIIRDSKELGVVTKVLPMSAASMVKVAGTGETAYYRNEYLEHVANPTPAVQSVPDWAYEEQLPLDDEKRSVQYWMQFKEDVLKAVRRVIDIALTSKGGQK